MPTKEILNNKSRSSRSIRGVNLNHLYFLNRSDIKVGIFAGLISFKTSVRFIAPSGSFLGGATTTSPLFTLSIILNGFISLVKVSFLNALPRGLVIALKAPDRSADD